MSFKGVWAKIAGGGAPWILLVLVSLLNVFLIRQNLHIRSAVDELKPNVLQPGERVKPFSAEQLSGGTIQLNYTGKETKRVLLYFNSACPYCHEQFTYWRELLSRINGNHFQVIGIVSDSEDRTRVKEYLHSVGCDDLPVAVVSSDVRKDYKLSMTPTTLLIDNKGEIQRAWIGKWTEETVSLAASTFGVEFSQR